MAKNKVFQKMKDTVEAVHQHIEMEYSGEAFAMWIFGTEDSVTTLVTKPEKLSFARDTVTAAVASNPAVEHLLSEALENMELAELNGDEVVFYPDEAAQAELNRESVLSELDEELALMWHLLERALKTKRLRPNAVCAVSASRLADYVLPKFQRETGWGLEQAIDCLATVLEIGGAETIRNTENTSRSIIVFSKSIFTWPRS